MPRLLLLVNAHEPGALNLARAFRQAGHEVGLANTGARSAEQDEFVRAFTGAVLVRDLYAPRPRADRAVFLVDGAAHKLDGVPVLRALGPALVPSLDLLAGLRARDALAPVLRELAPDAVWGFWGAGPLAEFRALLRLRERPALVHQFQTYPLTRQRTGSRQASALHRAVFGRLDGRASASPEMEAFLDAALRPTRGRDQVLPEAWGSWAVAKERLPRLSLRDGAPHVVHAGAAPARARSVDDVGPLLAGVAAQGVHVHAPEAFALRGERLHSYPRSGLDALLDGRFASFLTQFDALLVAYRAPPGLQWFAGNMPARFLSGVSAGVPVAVPRGLFGAAQRFVEEHGNGLVFDSPQDLAAGLRDDGAMAKARERALALQREHVLERFLPRYEGFLEGVLGLRAGRWGSATAK